jgi:threonylcarbamoyladenosine tRNA methylthiotransferase MtaB
LRAARRRNPDATIVATGCYAQHAPDAIRQLEEVDIVAGNTDKPTLVRQIVDWRGNTPVPCAVGEETAMVSPRVMRTRAMVKIQEGCDQVCAYCIVPKVRGRERSVPPDSLVNEIDQYVERGYKEVVLTGTQLGSYGFDMPNIDLKKLVARILSETAVSRLRISSLQPQEITPGFLELWSDERLCPHFHMPLQSGSDTVLKRMRRRYTSEQYAGTAELIREMIPGASITADVIVGFPGESVDEFEQTFALCERVGFADMHAFPYSIRPGTSAAHFAEQVAPEIKSERMSRLLTLANRQAQEFRTSLLKASRPVLWEEVREIEGKDMWSGLTDNYVRAVAESSRDLTNRITQAHLVGQQGELVYAEVGL